MEVLLPDGLERKRWRINGVTYYFKAGRLCQCNSRRPRLSKGKKKDGKPLLWTPEQEKAKAVFRLMVHLKRFYFRQIAGIPIWDVAPGIPGQTRLSKFHSVNSEACDERGVVNYAVFMFSIGRLFRPVNPRAIRNGWTITVTWENRENRELSCGSDWLRVGYFYDSYPMSPGLLPEVVAKRADCRAVFTIPNPGIFDTEVLHLYLFFSRKDRIAFSPSEYLRV